MTPEPTPRIRSQLSSKCMTAAPTGFFVFIQYRLITIKNTSTVSHCPQHAPSISVVGRAQTISITGSAAEQAEGIFDLLVDRKLI